MYQHIINSFTINVSPINLPVDNLPTEIGLNELVPTATHIHVFLLKVKTISFGKPDGMCLGDGCKWKSPFKFGWMNQKSKSWNFCLVFPTQLEETHILTKVIKKCTYIVKLVPDSTVILCSGL